MTMANKITMLRILLVPVFVALVVHYGRTGQPDYRWAALGAFAVAALADAMDGFIARHYNQRSDLGAILDPLADKLLLTAAIVLFSFWREGLLARIPLWLLAVVLGRDAITLLGVALIRSRKRKVQIRAHLTGKIATILLMATILWILLGWNEQVLKCLIIGTGVFTVASALFYILDGVRQFYSHPSGAETASRN